MSGPLEGFVVVDASSFVFGPVATQMLGDMGADVVKVEPPEGDPTRGIGRARHPGMGSFFLNLNRNKRSVVLDLKRPAHADAMRRLLAAADVFVHNLRPRALAKLGLDAKTLHASHPRLVHASAQGFGRGGRYSDRAAYDDVIQGMSGIAALHGAVSGAPAYAPMLLTDKLCAPSLVAAIAMALVHRERTGRGQAVEVPMFETVASFNLYDHMADDVFVDDDGDDTIAGYGRALSPNHRPLRTRDGYVCVIANTDAQWQRLFAAIGRADLAADPRFATIGERMNHVGELYAAVEDALAHRGTDDWLPSFQAADVPAAPVQSLTDVRRDPHLADRGFFRRVEHPSEGALLMTDLPTTFGASPGGLRRGPPRLGEHTAEVFGALGYTADELRALDLAAS